jgi:site-specific DNA-methyltransferase (cytosine-N4-specific)
MDKDSYEVSNFGHGLLQAYEDFKDKEIIHKHFATHILKNLSGLSLLRSIQNILDRSEKPTLETIAYELQELGYVIPPNCTYHSTMKMWLELGKVINKYDIDWDLVSNMLSLTKDHMDELYSLNKPQKYFLMSMIQCNIEEWTEWPKIAKYTKSRYQLRLPTKSFVKDIIEPLIKLGLIETEKTTTGRGAKPNLVKLTEKAKSDLVLPLLQEIAEITNISTIDLNRKFEDVIQDLTDSDRYIKGIALELLAIWLIRLTSLRFTKWRVRGFESTGGGEVDVLASSDKFVYSRWQIQCKNTKTVTIDVLAKEIGMSFVTGADIILIATTGYFTNEALQYATRITEVSRYYFILIDKNDIEKIKNDKLSIIEILDKQARKIFAKRELQSSEDEIFALEQEGDNLKESYEQLELIEEV